MKKTARKPEAFDTANMPILVEGEQEIARAQIHPAIFWKGAVVLALGLYLLFTVFNLGVMFTVIGLFMCGVAWASRLYLMLLVTNRRVVIRHGIFIWVDTTEMRLSQIESVEMNQMLLGQIFGYGNLVITGTGNRATRVPYVANPEKIRRAVDEILLAREARQDQ